MDLKTLQAEHKEWLAHNFPNQVDFPYHALLGVVEEVGELSHAHLKREQGIRGTAEKHHEDAKDAVGDIIIYLASYCNTMGYDLDACVSLAWTQVRDRDWQADPEGKNA